MLAAFQNIESSYQPTLTVIIVHKRINTRLFAKTVSFQLKKQVQMN